MFETTEIVGYIEKVQYKSKVDTPDKLSSDAIVEATIKVPLSHAILREVERRYFPGLFQRCEISSDRSREYKDVYKFKAEEQSLWIYDKEGDKLVEVKDAEPANQITVLCKDGWAEMFVKVKFRTSVSLELLKALDQRAIKFTMQQTQMEFDSALEEAKRLDKLVAPAEKQREVITERIRLSKDFPLGDTNEVKDDDNAVPPIATTASEKPISIGQVDYRLCSIPADKAKEELAGLPEEEEYELGQTAAIVAYDRQVAAGKNGNTVRITLSDIEKAKMQLKG